MLEHIDKYTKVLNEKLEATCAYVDVSLESRFEILRGAETNLGNMIADIFRTEYDNTDVALLPSGSLRNNCVTQPGYLSLKNIQQIIPMDEALYRVKVPGDVLLQALENSVSQYPKLSGRFAQVSGLSFEWDSRKDPGKRVGKVTMASGEPLSLTKDYVVILNNFSKIGKDGYACLLDPRVKHLTD